jgi:tubulin polyglutamylase TTLL2
MFSVRFSPQCYNLPLEYTKLVAEFNQGKSNGNAVWICKPVGQSQGRGIFLFKVGNMVPELYSLEAI